MKYMNNRFMMFAFANRERFAAFMAA